MITIELLVLDSSTWNHLTVQINNVEWIISVSNTI